MTIVFIHSPCTGNVFCRWSSCWLLVGQWWTCAGLLLQTHVRHLNGQKRFGDSVGGPHRLACTGEAGQGTNFAVTCLSGVCKGLARWRFHSNPPVPYECTS